LPKWLISQLTLCSLSPTTFEEKDIEQRYPTVSSEAFMLDESNLQFSIVDGELVYEEKPISEKYPEVTSSEDLKNPFREQNSELYYEEGDFENSE